MQKIIQPVAQIITNSGEAGVGFLVDKRTMITSLQLLPDLQTALSSSVSFVVNEDAQAAYTSSWNIHPDGYRVMVQRDLVCLELLPDAHGNLPGELWGYYPVAWNERTINAFDELTYVHYPEKNVLETGQVLVTDVDEKGNLFYYGCWLQHHSAGAPLLNAQMEVVGMHNRKYGSITTSYAPRGKQPATWQTLQLST